MVSSAAPFALAAFALALLVIPACSSQTGTTAAPHAGGGAGIVSGAKDTHCTSTVTVDPAACTAEAGAPEGADGGAAVSDYGETLFNDEGDDDDCKYHVKWSAASVGENADVTFTVVISHKVDGSPVAGAPVRAEVYLNDTHPAPNTNQTSKETSAGTYAVGPIRFDAQGQWTIRFHVHEECNDSPESPHGHAAFHVQVP